MNDILKLNKDFKIYLDASTQQIVSDLKDILYGKSVVYLEDKTASDIVVKWMHISLFMIPYLKLISIH